MKMVIDVNIDSIFSAIENADWDEGCYQTLLKKEPHGNYEAIRKWKWDCEYRLKELDRSNDAVIAIVSVFNMHDEAQRRMRIALRAKQRWEKKTGGYLRLPDEKMMKQFANFIFDDPKNDPYGYGYHGFVINKLYFWNNDVYEREAD